MEIFNCCEYIERDRQGDLKIEGCDAQELARRYGTPLYVTSEAQLRYNYRKIRDTFVRAYPKTQLLCAMKANNNMALRHILSDEGAGGEAFGPGELVALLQSGADPRKCVLNGGYKDEFELTLAIGSGVRINADSRKELEDIETIAQRLDKPVEIRLRLRLCVPEFDDVPAQAGGKTISDRFARSKFGLTAAQALECARYIKDSKYMTLCGYNFHLGRQSLETSHFQYTIREMMRTADLIRRETGIEAQVINIGGGLPSSVRDPEGHGTSGRVPSLTQYANAMAETLRQGVADGLLTKEPVLELEPGRSIVGCTTVLLTTVKLSKENLGHRWLHVDCGGNQLSRIDSARYYYQTIKAHHAPGEESAPEERVDVVGHLCSGDSISTDMLLRAPKEGDLLAVLDAGMYAETTASQFNGRPRPATVLVSGSGSDIIKRRETIRDVFATQCVPARLECLRDRESVCSR